MLSPSQICWRTYRRSNLQTPATGEVKYLRVRRLIWLTTTLQMRTGLNVGAILRGSFFFAKTWWVYILYMYIHTTTYVCDSMPVQDIVRCYLRFDMWCVCIIVCIYIIYIYIYIYICIAGCLFSFDMTYVSCTCRLICIHPANRLTGMLCSSEFQNLRTTGNVLLDLQTFSSSPADVQSMSMSGTKRPRGNWTPALLATHRMPTWPATTELRWWGVFWSLTQKKKMKKVMIASMMKNNLQRWVSKLKLLKPWMLPKAQRIWSRFHKRRWSWTSPTQEMWIEKMTGRWGNFKNMSDLRV